MSTLSNKLVAVCLVAAFSMVMYGCGGGGSSSTPEVPTTPDPTDPTDPTDPPAPMTHDVDLSTLLAGYNTVPAGEHMIDAGMDMDVGDATFTCPAGGDACTVTVAADGTATSTGGAATAAPSMAATDRKAADDEADRLAEIARMAVITKAEAIEMAIGPDEPNIADADGATEGDQLVINVTAVLGGATVPDSAVDTAVEEKFAAGDRPASITGWTDAKYERTQEGDANANPPTNTVVDTFVKYNNKAPNTAQLYTAYFGGTENNAGDAVDSITGAVLTLDVDDIDGNHMLFSGDFGITGPHQNLPAPVNDADTPDVDEGIINVSGSFRGVPGTFTCPSECTVSSDEDSNLDDLGGSWTFTPSGSATGGGPTTAELAALMVQGVIPDPDFMAFGYWLQATTDADGETEYAFLGFNEGNRNFGDVDGVEGTATYEGPATGMYMRKRFEVSEDGSSTTTHPVISGQFTASAVLNATFAQISSGDDQDTIAPAMFNTITGSISGFKDGYGADIDTRWTVELTDGTIIDTGDGAGTFSGTATGMGAFAGTFHGEAIANDDPDTDVDETTLAPIGASGTFDGHFENGHVRGAFGVDRQ